MPVLMAHIVEKVNSSKTKSEVLCDNEGDASVPAALFQFI